mgnify:CR=1 FL=1
MQISIETTTQSTSILSATFTSSGRSGNSAEQTEQNAPKAPALTALEAATKKAEEDAVVIAALQDAVEKGKGETEEDSEETALATIEDYQETAGKLRSALGEDGDKPTLAYESATISTTTIEAEIDGNTLSAEFVSFERVSYDSATGLTARSASATNIEADFGNVTASYQNASVSSLYAGTGTQIGNLIEGLA